MSLSLRKIDDYIAALVMNATELIAEAKLLHAAKAYARAHALAHLAREEIAKCVVLHAAGQRIVAGVPVDWATTMKRLRSHKAKIQLEIVSQALLLAAMGRKDLMDVVFRSLESQVNHRDDRKNAALYVGLSEGKLSRPSEEFTEAQAHRTIGLAETALDFECRMIRASGKFGDKAPGSNPALGAAMPTKQEDVIRYFEALPAIYSELVKQLYRDAEPSDRPEAK